MKTGFGGIGSICGGDAREREEVLDRSQLSGVGPVPVLHHLLNAK